MPALAPLCLSLVGVAGVYRYGRRRDYALAGAALGVACATKYTAGIVLLCLLAAAVLGARRRRLRGLALAGVLAVVGFVVANPYALLDCDAFRDGPAQAVRGVRRRRRQARPARRQRAPVLPADADLGARLAAGAGRRRRRGRARASSDRALACGARPRAASCFLLFMGIQDRFFARWLLPVYPLLCLLAAWAAVEAAARVQPAGRCGRWPRPARCCARRASSSRSTTTCVLARADTRALARAWMVANIPAGGKVVIEPIAPDQWAMDTRPAVARDRHRQPLDEVADLALQGRGRSSSRTTSARCAPACSTATPARGYCYVVTGSTQYGRALNEPERGAARDRLLRRARAAQRRRLPRQPDARRPPGRRFSFDFSFNSYPLGYERAGPEIVIRSTDGIVDCAVNMLE